MDYPNNTTNSRKHKHLNFEERMLIQVRLKDGFSPYKIAKELGRASNTIRNEIARGTVTQIKQGRKVEPYLADVGENTYRENRKHCCPKFKRLSCEDFIVYVFSKFLFIFFHLRLLSRQTTDSTCPVLGNISNGATSAGAYSSRRAERSRAWVAGLQET